MRVLAVVVCLLAAGCVAPPSTPTPTATPVEPVPGLDGTWSMYRGGPSLLGAAESFNGKQLDGANSLNLTGAVAPPVVVGKAAYLAFDGFLARFNLDTMRTEWTFNAAITVAPSVRADRVVVAASNALYVLNAATGTAQWERPLNGVDAQPALDDQRVYVPARGVSAFALQGGSPTWNVTFGGPTSAPILREGKLYVTWSDADGAWLAVFTTANGQEQWRKKVDPESYASAPAVIGSTVLVSTKHSVAAYDAATGAQKWKKETGNQPSPPAALSGTVLFIDWDNRLTALDSSTGSKKWDYLIGDALCEAQTNPGACLKPTLLLCANADSVLVAGWDGFLHVVDARTGQSQTRQPLSGGHFDCAWSADKVVLLSSSSLHVYDLEPADV